MENAIFDEEKSSRSLHQPLLKPQDKEEKTTANTDPPARITPTEHSARSERKSLNTHSSNSGRKLSLRKKSFKLKFRDNIKEIKSSPRCDLATEIFTYIGRNFLRTLTTQTRRTLIGLVGSRIDQGANATSRDLLNPLFTIAASIPGTLKKEVVTNYKKGFKNHDIDYLQKAFAFYRFTTLLSFAVITPAAVLITLMPQILNNDALKRMTPAFQVFPLSSFVTILNASSVSLTDALSDKRKNLHLKFALISDVFIIASAVLGLKFESFLLIALSQLLISAIGALFAYKNVLNGLREIGCEDTQALSLQEKKQCAKVMLQCLPMAVADSVSQIAFVALLQAKPNSEAAIEAFFTESQLYFIPGVIFKPIAGAMSYFITDTRTEKSRRLAQRLIVGAATMLSALLATFLFIEKDSIITLLNPPNDDDAIQANKITSNFFNYLLTMISLFLEAPALAFADKTSYVHGKRLLATAIDVLPSVLAILISQAIDFSPEMMLRMIIFSWGFADALNIAVGALLPENFTDQHQPAPPKLAALLLSPDMITEEKNQAFQQFEMSHSHSARSLQSASAPRMADPVRQMTQTINGHRGSELEEKPYRSHRSSNSRLLDDAEQGVA